MTRTLNPCACVREGERRLVDGRVGWPSWALTPRGTPSLGKREAVARSRMPFPQMALA